MSKYNLGEVWWTDFPFEDINASKHRPAIVLDDETIAVLAIKVTSQEKDDPYRIKIDDWKSAGLTKESWARIDQIIHIDEWRMDKKIGDLSSDDLLKITQLVAEIVADIYHEFSLLAIKNAEGKYLQVYDERWKCWLFPYYRYEDPNKANIDKHTSELFKMDVTTSHVAHTLHCKYSESDKMYKRYKHTLYSLVLNEIPDYMTGEDFELDDKKYAWKSIAELEADSNVMEKNDDVIAFVKSKCK